MGILSIFKGKGNVLFYPGCLTKYVLKQEAENYRKILEKIGVDFIIIPEINCCGSPVLNAGYEKDARKLARKNLEIFKKYNVRKIVTNCPACFKTFFKDYKEMLPDWKIETEHIIFPILKYLKSKRIKYESRERLAYHDPCHLGRHCGIYEEPREILRLLGYEVVDFPNSRNESFCCGGGAGLKTNNPELAKKIAKERVKQARNLNVKKIVTPCPLCFAHIAENSDTESKLSVPQNPAGFSGIEVSEFSHIVAKSLGIEVGKTSLQEMMKKDKEACS